MHRISSSKHKLHDCIFFIPYARPTLPASAMGIVPASLAEQAQKKQGKGHAKAPLWGRQLAPWANVGMCTAAARIAEDTSEVRLARVCCSAPHRRGGGGGGLLRRSQCDALGAAPKAVLSERPTCVEAVARTKARRYKRLLSHYPNNEGRMCHVWAAAFWPATPCM